MYVLVDSQRRRLATSATLRNSGPVRGKTQCQEKQLCVTEKTRTDGGHASLRLRYFFLSTRR